MEHIFLMLTFPKRALIFRTEITLFSRKSDLSERRDQNHTVNTDRNRMEHLEVVTELVTIQVVDFDILVFSGIQKKLSEEWRVNNNHLKYSSD